MIVSEAQTAAAAATPQLIDFEDPIVVAQIEAAAFRLASVRAAAAVQTVPSVAVDRTSVAQYAPSPDEVTVQFTRFTLTNNTSYMVGQTAGFPSRQARALVASGHAKAVHMHKPPLAASRRARS